MVARFEPDLGRDEMKFEFIKRPRIKRMFADISFIWQTRRVLVELVEACDGASLFDFDLRGVLDKDSMMGFLAHSQTLSSFISIVEIQTRQETYHSVIRLRTLMVRIR